MGRKGLGERETRKIIIPRTYSQNHIELLLNFLQESSFSNQITFILHIQGVFSLPGRGFHQRVTLVSSVPMTFDDVIVHVRQFIIALVSVDGCSSFFLIQMASLMCRILRLGSLSTMFTPSQSMMWFSVVAWSVRADLLMVDINLFFPLLVYFSFFVLSTSFLCSSSRVFSSLPLSPMYSFLPNVLSTTVLAWYLVHQFTLFF